MRFARSTFLFGLLGLLCASVPPSCNTKAVGVSECRDIEYARCEEGIHCAEAFAIESVSACKRFYRDQCLRGLDVSETPGKPEVSECTGLIHRLGNCAKDNGEKSLITDCDDVTVTSTEVTTVCELMKSPQYSKSCSFLIDNSKGGSGGDGGDGGSGGSSGSSGNSNGGSSGESS
jgi:uncharacterized membrane protein YgcG